LIYIIKPCHAAEGRTAGHARGWQGPEVHGGYWKRPSPAKAEPLAASAAGKPYGKTEAKASAEKPAAKAAPQILASQADRGGTA